MRLAPTFAAALLGRVVPQPSETAPADSSGQLSFLTEAERAELLVPEDDRIPPSAAEIIGRLTIERRLSNPSYVWTAGVAIHQFRRLFARHEFDEEVAYAALLDLGCPLSMADEAWDSWAREVAEVAAVAL